MPDKKQPLLYKPSTSSIARDLFSPMADTWSKLALARFKGQKQSRALARLIWKCRKRGMTEKQMEYELIVAALQGDGAHRAMLVAQTDMKLAVPEFFGGSIKAFHEHLRAQRNGKEQQEENTNV